MPLFVFHCRACDSDFELLVRGDETPRCPNCGSTNLEKQLSAFAVASSARQSFEGCGAANCCRLDGGACAN